MRRSLWNLVLLLMLAAMALPVAAETQSAAVAAGSLASKVNFFASEPQRISAR
jgi:hypothetical protein